MYDSIGPMKIAIVNLTSGGFSGGYLKYLRHIVPLLKGDVRVASLHMFAPQAAVGLLDEFTIPVSSWPGWDSLRGFAHLRADLAKLQPDVVFIPTARWFNCSVPTVIMVRNMESLAEPLWKNPTGERLRNLLRARAAKQACRHATRVIAVSNYVRDYLDNEWKISPDKLGVVYHGTKLSDDGDADVPTQLRNLQPQQFIFTAGSIRPARGLEDILEAYAQMPEGLRKTLVIAGGVDPRMGFYRNRLEELATRYGIERYLRWVGKLSERQMTWCYRNCRVFVVTSRAEACPNTVLESLEAGCLCVSSDQPPMPEFFSNAAIYYRRRDPMDLRIGLEKALTLSQPDHERFRQVARDRTVDFKWACTADLTLNQLELARTARSLRKPS